MTASLLAAPLSLHEGGSYALPAVPVVLDLTGAGLVADPAAARKRRREILANGRKVISSQDSLHSGCSTDASDNFPATKKRKDDIPFPLEMISLQSKEDQNDETKERKGQLKYDPDVPMTKDEASAWRREQRRKRNRESAAASRQRQQCRVAELEQELSVLKTQYEALLQKIQESVQSSKSTKDSPHISVSSLSPCDASNEVFSTASEDTSSSRRPVTPPIVGSKDNVRFATSSPTSCVNVDPTQEFFKPESSKQSVHAKEIQACVPNYSSSIPKYLDGPYQFGDSQRFASQFPAEGEDHLNLALSTNLISRPAVSVIVCY